MKSHLERAKAPWDTSLEQFNVTLNARLSGLQKSISACETVHQRNAALLYQLATESNPAVIKETIKYHFGMLRANRGDVGAVLAARMTAEIPGGSVAGSPSTSPA